MPSPPSASADHFACLIQDLQADTRLTPAKLRLLVRTVRRARQEYFFAPEPVKLLMSTMLRCYWALICGPPDATTTLRAVDGFVRLGRQLGFLTPEMMRRGRMMSWGRERVRPPAGQSW